MNDIQIHKVSRNNKLLLEKYIIIKNIKAGSFGTVYLAIDGCQKQYAVKVESKAKQQRLLCEYKIYKNLHKNKNIIGVPKIYDMMETQDYNIMVMQLLGNDLESVFEQYNHHFELSTIFKLMIDILNIIESVHNANYIHRDIKPTNFMMDVNDLSKLYLVDYGLSKPYINENGNHISYKTGKSIVGTTRYCSIRTHLGIESSRRDDLEAIGYMILYFAKDGLLPWQGLKKIKGVDHFSAIGDCKICVSVEKLCQGLPKCFELYITYCKELQFHENPNYEYLRNLFINDAKKLNIKLQYEWINTKNIT